MSLRRPTRARLIPIALALLAACGDGGTGLPSLGGRGFTVTASPTQVTALQGDESDFFTVTVTRQGNFTGETELRIREGDGNAPAGVTLVGGGSTDGAVTTWTMNFVTTPATPVGNHDIVIEAVPEDGSSLSPRTVTVRLTVIDDAP